MPLYIYNNINIIIIVTNVNILEFLSARFIHPSFCYHFIFFLHELEHKNNESY